LPEKGDLEANVLEKLPEDFDYKVEILDGSEEKFELRVATSNITTENVNGWLVEFQAMNDVCLKIKMAKKPTKGFLIQNYYRCHHNTRKWSPSKDPQRKLKTNPTARVKNTNCPFQMVVKINTSQVCTIDIDWEHNHSISSLESSNYKDLSPECIEKVNKLYEAGHTSSSARHQFMKDLRASCDDEVTFHMKKADRSIMPRRRDFGHLYRKFTKENFGGHQEEMFVKLAEKLSEYQQSNPEATIDFQLYAGETTPLIVSVVTPLMKRIHKHIEQSGELVFVDSTSNTEAHNLNIFLLCTHSVAGALPCGLLITSDEKESTLIKGFTMLQNCLPDYAFYGNGPTVGAKIMLTDNCQEERNALKCVWPSAILLLCIFHILQQAWRWLLDKNHQIRQNARPEILGLFKKALYAKSEEIFEETYGELLDEMDEIYPQAFNYFEGLYQERKSFALCFRTSLLVRGNQTNNFVESQFLVLKDVILGRVKEYNLVALFDRLTVDLENHYKDKLLSVVDGSFDGHFRRRFLGKQKQKSDGAQGFKVPSEDVQKRFLETVQEFPNGIFQVSSVSQDSKR
jgi:hypothetical protein